MRGRVLQKMSADTAGWNACCQTTKRKEQMHSLKPLAAAVLAAMLACGAQAGQVTISGIMDTGINIQQVKNGDRPSDR